MKRTYGLVLVVEGPDDTNIGALDRVVSTLDWSDAREAIDTAIFGACDHITVDVTSLRPLQLGDRVEL